jgi:hypothetical protein
MYMLVDEGKRFDNKEYLNKGLATLHYILAKQNSDGSWPYSQDQEFVDCYHTVFVIKNLIARKLDICPWYSIESKAALATICIPSKEIKCFGVKSIRFFGSFANDSSINNSSDIAFLSS